MFYRTPQPSRLMATAVTLRDGSIEFGSARPLFLMPSGGPFDYDISPDGQHVFVNRLSDMAGEPLTLVVNWPAALKK
jgi:hypothetical protein